MRGSTDAVSNETGLGSITGKSLRTASTPRIAAGQARGPADRIRVPPRRATNDSSRAQASAAKSPGSTSPTNDGVVGAQRVGVIGSGRRR